MIRIDRQVALPVEAPQQLEDLRLDRHVEGRGRLVGDQHVRVQRQRHRDHRPLPHPARELVGVGVGSPFGLRDADRVQHLHRQPPGLLVANPLAVGADRLDDLVADPVDRVEGGHRVLEDHRDPVAPDPSQLGLARVQQLLATQPRGALDPRVRRAGQAEDRLRGDALARARLADDRQYLAGGETEGDLVDRLQPTAFGDEPDSQVAHGEQRLAHRCDSPSRIRGSR